MEKRPAALLLKFPGTNCDAETARALRTVGFDAQILPISRVTPERLKHASLIVLSGGFSYGDYIMAGKLAQLEIERQLQDALHRFHAEGGHLLGICNGFQILMRLGLLPRGSLIHNTNGRFICQWVRLNRTCRQSPYLRGLPDSFELPVAHAEGRFVVEESHAQRYLRDGLVTLTYADNINGSVCDIAGIQDPTHRVFGLMPHPERYLHAEDHYDPTREDAPPRGWGHHFFQSIHDAILETQPLPGS